MKIIEKADSKTTLSVHKEELRALHGSIRESFEEIEPHVFETRIGVAIPEARQLMARFHAAYSRRGRKKRISVSDKELATIRNTLEATLEIEDWEFHPRMGFTKAEVRKVLAGVAALARQRGHAHRGA